MNPGPQVSVVIPAYNAEPWVADAIDSARQQIPAPLEIIVVDDGSTDGTAACAEAHGARVIRQANRGPSAARNAGAATASGDALLFLDADDSLLPGALERMLTEAAVRPGWVAVVPNYLHEGSASGPAWPERQGSEVFDRKSVGTMLLANRLSPNALVRQEAWRRHPFREDLRTAEDLDLWLRLLLKGGDVLRLGTPLVRKRVGRVGAASVDVRSMRVGRREVFAGLWRRRDLGAKERAILLYQLARTTIGVWLAPRAVASRRGSSGVVHVYMGDRGGGREHVALLRRRMEARIATRDMALPSPASWRLRDWMRSVRLAARAIGADRPLVHAHGIRAAAIALPAVMVRRVPLVITIHGLHSLRRSNTIAVRFMDRRVMRRASIVMVLSDSDRRSIASARLVPDHRVRMIRAGFEPRQVPDRVSARRTLGLPRDAVVVLWLGRLSTEKDPMAFVEAFTRIAQPGVVGLIAGDGSCSSEVARVVGSRGSATRIHLLGWLDDPGEAIGAADMLVSTSRWEGLPIGVLEAAAAGLPVIVTDVPGNRDLRGAGVPALLVPVGDPEALSSAIGELAVDADRRLELGERAAKFVRSTFTPDALVQDVMAVYDEVAPEVPYAFGRRLRDVTRY